MISFIFIFSSLNIFLWILNLEINRIHCLRTDVSVNEGDKYSISLHYQSPPFGNQQGVESKIIIKIMTIFVWRLTNMTSLFSFTWPCTRQVTRVKPFEVYVHLASAHLERANLLNYNHNSLLKSNQIFTNNRNFFCNNAGSLVNNTLLHQDFLYLLGHLFSLYTFFLV